MWHHEAGSSHTGLLHHSKRVVIVALPAQKAPAKSDGINGAHGRGAGHRRDGHVPLVLAARAPGSMAANRIISVFYPQVHFGVTGELLQTSCSWALP